MKQKSSKGPNKNSDLPNSQPEEQSGTENNVSSDTTESEVSDETMKEITAKLIEAKKGKNNSIMRYIWNYLSSINKTVYI